MTATDLQYSDVFQAVEEGFSKTPKCLPSWLFYDETGDKIFQEIMRMPEYYLTTSEYEILQMNKTRLRNRFVADGTPFKLVELGAGDGLKTEILLKHFSEHQIPFTYSPIDVSATVLSQLEARLRQTVTGLVMHPINRKYHEALEILSYDEVRKVFLFLGANIGNFTLDQAGSFIKSLSSSMHVDDHILIGFDLKKDPRLIQAAYDDPHGITRDFNLNLLVRLNRELGARFQLDQFRHYPYYNPETGMTKSYLISQQEQDVYFEACDKYVHFDRWEVIHTEISQKYDMPMIRKLAAHAGLEINDIYFDCKHYFCDVLMKKC